MTERFFKEIPEGQSMESDGWQARASLGLATGDTWADLLRRKRVLIVSEAGAGKSYECEECAKQLWKDGEAAFHLELASLATEEFRTLLSMDQDARFDRWLSSQSEIATFFLDSIDELKLSLGSFRLALSRLAKAITGRLERARIVITTRPVPFDEELVREILPVPTISEKVEPSGDEFAKIVLKGGAATESAEKDLPAWVTVTLLPLTDHQIIEFARLRGVDDPEIMMADLKRRNAEEFARRPQDLIELCEDWKDYKRIRTHREQVESNIRLKLKPREERHEPAELSVQKAMNGARRLALAMMVTRRLTIRHSAESDHGGSEAAFDPKLVLQDWNPAEIKALLERALFGVASYGRVRFHHRSILEFLAAARLIELRESGMSAKALKRLIFTETRGKTIVRHSKRAMAGWLALEEPAIYEALRDNEPEVLLNEGDPESLTPSQRNETLHAFVKCHGTGGWRGKRVPKIQIHRFASPELSEQINTLWQEGVENPEIRELLLGLIECGSISGCYEIAYASATDKTTDTGERLDALDTLASIGDSRLPGIIDNLAAGSPEWPEKLTKIAVMRLFPKHLGINHLFQILSRIRFRETGSGDLSWFLPSIIKEHPWKSVELEAIRDGLVELISADLKWQKQWPHYVSSNDRLGGLLSIACVKGLKAGAATKWLQASLLAMLMAHHEYPENKEFSALLDVLNALPANESEELFWITDKLLQSLNPETDPLKRFTATRINWKITLNFERDAVWIRRNLASSGMDTADRALLLEAAMQISPGEGAWLPYLSELKAEVADLPELVAKIDGRIKQWSEKREPQEWEAENAKWKEEAKRKEAENLASCKDFFEKVSSDPAEAFSKEETQTVWNLWRAMRKAGSKQHESDWNRQFIESYFGEDTANRLRHIMMRFWRSDKPTLTSERSEDEKNTFLVRWQLGLAGIYAEAEDSTWASKLTENEAGLAVRYATMELNSLPSWIGALAELHSTVIEEILGNEMIAELNAANRDEFHSMTLQNIGHSADAVRTLFIPRLCKWLSEKSESACPTHLTRGETQQISQVLGFLTEHGSQEVVSNLANMAKDHLTKKLPISLAKIWLSTLLRFDPEAGLCALEQRIQEITPAARSEAVTLLGWLFGHRGASLEVSCKHFTPRQLLRLMRIHYTHVRVSDDARHEGCYSPDDRDNAENARNNIVNLLLSASGKEGWDVKMEMCQESFCSHFKDRILAVAEECWAEEIDSIAYNDQQAVALDQTGETPPSTNEAMFDLMVNRLEEIDEILLQDASPRSLWSNIAAEQEMRRAIARELIQLARNNYKVDQEAVTADEKETDIRLRSTASNYEAVIELKLADNRSTNDLLETLEKQLVAKYMASDYSRSGCLLITLSKSRKWDHPNGGERIDYAELIDLLREEADKIAHKHGHSIRLHVHGLDLRPRLQTEK
jgi:hypothetical protein